MPFPYHHLCHVCFVSVASLPLFVIQNQNSCFALMVGTRKWVDRLVEHSAVRSAAVLVKPLVQVVRRTFAIIVLCNKSTQRAASCPFGRVRVQCASPAAWNINRTVSAVRWQCDERGRKRRQTAAATTTTTGLRILLGFGVGPALHKLHREVAKTKRKQQKNKSRAHQLHPRAGSVDGWTEKSYN